MLDGTNPPHKPLDTNVTFTGILFACPFDQKSHTSCFLCGLREAPIRARVDAANAADQSTKEEVVRHHAACLRRLVAEGKRLEASSELAAKVSELVSRAHFQDPGRSACCE